jgi:glycosyltransferase involved in cell wall biosynthesis
MTHSSRIKILHVITGLDLAGSQMMLVNLVRSMSRERFDNVVVSLQDGGLRRSELEALGIPVFSLGVGRGVPNPWGLIRLLRLLSRERPDVVQSWLYHADLLGLVGARMSRVPVCAWNIRTSEMDMTRYSMVSRLVLGSLSWLSQYPDVVVVNSEAGRKLHESLGFRPRRWALIPNGFDLDRFRPDSGARERLRQQLGAPNSFLIGLVARYDPMKDHRTFLEAAARFVERRPDTRFVLAGGEIDKDNLQLTGLIHDLGLSGSVDLLGERADIESVMAALDILSLSSTAEGFPNCVGEAMACGVPCVTTDVGDAAILVGETGRVVPIREPAALADAWSQLYDMSDEARVELGMAGRRRIEESFSLASVARQYEDLYEGLLVSP